ncbi:MAG TPA: hypothetical protein PK728_03130 [Bacillota bacterium]|nr:hypothetical protein [Bacillota bacterium]
MNASAALPLIYRVICIELMQIRRLSRLADAAPDECTRQIILLCMKDEIGEVMFWNTVLAAYRTEAVPLPGPGNTCPAARPGAVCPFAASVTCPGPGAPCPVSPGMGLGPGPGAGAGPGMGFGPGFACPVSPGVTCPGVRPGAPCPAIGGAPCPVSPGTMPFSEKKKDGK